MFGGGKMWEGLALIRALTFIKTINVLKVTVSYVWSRLFRNAWVIGKPFAVSFEPTSTCNLRCPECPTGANLLKRPRGTIKVSNYSAILDQLTDHLLYLNLYVQGEPFMHPELEKLIQLAASRHIYTSTSTNGHFIDNRRAVKIVEAGLTRIIFSVDGSTQESYARYRVGGELEKVKKAIQNVVQAKKEKNSKYPVVVMQFLVFRHNEHEVPEMRRLAKELGADRLEIKTAQFNDFGNGQVEAPDNSRFSRYSNAKTQELQKRSYNHCWRQWHSAVITWDGRVSPCCYDKDSIYCYGNLADTDAKVVFGNQQDLDFKNKVLFDKEKINICNNCPEGRSWLP